jgi:exopolysaccharide biosynthesis polyprenyl glycosylphosphotransferase
VSVLDTSFGTAQFAPAQSRRAGNAYAPLKRALDLAVAIPALLFVLPLFAVIALLIKLDSKGPVFFRQKRIGFQGAAFDIFKFRSMRVLENGAHVAQATKDDPRVTCIGRFLRKSSLDELPQLLNIVKGEMSLVGPRPHARAHDEHYAPLIPSYVRRQAVKPGLTGWAQINGARGETPTVDVMRTRAEYDAWYAQNATLLLDIKILLRTPREILFSRNAY